jgi:hypothetical protein
MYCPQCGTPGSGNFCTGCGTRLAPAGGHEPADWSREVRYDRLVAHPEVRDLLAGAADKAGVRISAEQALTLHDRFLSKALGGGVELSDLAKIAVPILARLGFQATKQRSEMIDVPAGRAIVAVLCSLTSRGQRLKDVHQARDGCAIEAVLPSDVWSWEGTLFVTVAAEGDRSRLDARTRIGGQMYDWGKGTRCLEHLVQDVRSFRWPLSCAGISAPARGPRAGSGAIPAG